MIPVPAGAAKNIKNATVPMSDAVAASPKTLLEIRHKPVWLACFSGVLLVLSFPRFSLGFLGWISLVPLLLAIDSARSRRKILLYGLLTGLLFFGVSLHWITDVTFAGWLIFIAMEAVYIMLFGWFASRGLALRSDLLSVFWIALSWIASEFIRAEIPVFGFGWNLLAYSQSDYPWILQSANTLGGYGLGFVMALVNACIFRIIRVVGVPPRGYPRSQNDPLEGRPQGVAPTMRMLFLIFFLFALLLSHGFYHFQRKNQADQSVSVSLIQGNIAQDIKWEPVAREKILDIYMKMTELAAYDKPDLILWPEAAFPGYFNRDSEAERIYTLMRQIQIPLLLGSPHFEDWQTAYNSAYLLGKDAAIQARYDKLYLVPFGEYVPLKPLLGWLEPIAYSLGVSDFKPGSQWTLFKLPNEISFAVLICFEDSFPNLARQFVNRGARFLAVITNDAWFGDSAAPYQHLQASIFRAVENGVPLVRAANTGVSAFISKKGVVLDRVQDEKGKDIFVFGRKTLTLPLEEEYTLYRKGGYLFPYVALMVFAAMFILMSIRHFQWFRNPAVFVVLFCLCTVFSSCVRVAGKAGYWKQGPEDEAPAVKQVGFDTQNLVDRNKAPGSIET